LGKVVAFEPQPEMRDGIEQHKKRLNWLNLRVLNVALSDLDGPKRLPRQKIGDGSATLEVSRRCSEDETIEVSVTRLDAMPHDMFANLKFIKCGDALAGEFGHAPSKRDPSE
jgi:FkbM family methyltransferase